MSIYAGVPFPWAWAPPAWSGKGAGAGLELAEGICPEDLVTKYEVQGDLKEGSHGSQGRRLGLDESLMDELRFNEKIPNCT